MLTSERHSHSGRFAQVCNPAIFSQHDIQETQAQWQFVPQPCGGYHIINKYYKTEDSLGLLVWTNVTSEKRQYCYAQMETGFGGFFWLHVGKTTRGEWGNGAIWNIVQAEGQKPGCFYIINQRWGKTQTISKAGCLCFDPLETTRQDGQFVLIHDEESYDLDDHCLWTIEQV